MKKTFSAVCLVLVMIISCICVVGCSDDGSGDSANSIVGKWLQKEAGTGTEVQSVVMEFKLDGTFGGYYGGTYTEVGTYTVSGDSFSAKLYGQESKGTYSIKGDTLTITVNGETVVYTRYNGDPRNDKSLINPAEIEAAQPDSATVDAACKDYYAMCVAGKAPNEGTTKSEINAFIEKASIKDALDYANIGNVSLESMSVDSKGTIFATDNSSKTPDEDKTELLRNSKWEEEGSLKALYVTTNEASAEESSTDESAEEESSAVVFTADAATVDAACKDYYAMCMSGSAPGEGQTKAEIEEFLASASIKNALDYSNILYLTNNSFDNLSVDSKGNIFAEDDRMTPDETKTKILRNNKWKEEGSLKALYVTTNEASADESSEEFNIADAATVDAATADAACKDYYAMCVAGVIPGEGQTKEEREEFVAKASIKDALDYSNLLNVANSSFDKISVDSKGNIFATDDSSYTPDAAKTAFLRDNNWKKSGSLKSLYM